MCNIAASFPYRVSPYENEKDSLYARQRVQVEDAIYNKAVTFLCDVMAV